jgi:hypothetical protein
MKRMSLLALAATFVMTAFGQSASRIEIANPGKTALREQVIGIPWAAFSSRCGITDTLMFRLVDTRTKREIPVQLEHMGQSGVTQLLLQVDIPAGGKVSLRCERVARKPVTALTYGRYVPERADDFAWENDRIAFRAYGKALQSAKDNAHGLDVWVKRSRNMVINERYASKDYHNDRGNGLDYYHVGFTMGAGNMAPYWNDSVWYPGNYSRWEMLDNGPLRTTFRLYYDAVTLNGLTFKSTKTISLDAGSNMNRITVDYQVDGQDSIPVVIGVITRPDPGVILADEQQGLITYWEPTHPKWGTTGVGVIAPGGGKLKMTPLQMLLVRKIASGKPYTYMMGATWDREGIITNAEAWTERVRYHQAAEAALAGLQISFH